MVAATVCVASPANSQGRRGLSDAAATLQAFFQAVAGQRWVDAAALLDPTNLDAYRRQLLEHARTRLEQPELTVEKLLERDPQMPRAVAEYQVQQWKEHQSQGEPGLSDEFAEVDDPALLEILPIDSLAVRWLKAQHPAHEMRRALEREGCLVPPELDSVMSTLELQVIGTAPVEDDSAYVLFRSSWHGFLGHAFHDFGPQIALLRNTAKGWRVAARHDLIKANSGIWLEDCPRKPD